MNETDNPDDRLDGCELDFAEQTTRDEDVDGLLEENPDRTEAEEEERRAV